MNTYHVCFSGNLTCSGCNPCEACSSFVQQIVLPVAMMAAGFNQSREQASAFFNGYMAGWQKLHQLMTNHPQIAGQLKALNLAPLLQQFQNQLKPQSIVGTCVACNKNGELNQQGQCINGCQIQPIPQAQPLNSFGAPFPPFAPSQGQNPTQGMPFPPGQSQFINPTQGMPFPPGQSQGFYPQPIVQNKPESRQEIQSEINEKRDSEDKDRVRNMTTPISEKPMQEEEIAIAASPLPNGGLGVVLGSVMGPNFVPKNKENEGKEE